MTIMQAFALALGLILLLVGMPVGLTVLTDNPIIGLGVFMILFMAFGIWCVTQ